MPDIAEIVVRDYSNELSTMTMHTADLTDVNLGANQAALASLVAALDPVIRGEVAESRLKIVTPGTSILPTDEQAQVETAWLITYSDTSQWANPPTDTVPNPGFGLLFTMTLPTANYSPFLSPGSDLANLALPLVAAFVTAFEALYRSPYGGAVAIQSMRVMGVNI